MHIDFARALVIIHTVITTTPVRVVIKMGLLSPQMFPTFLGARKKKDTSLKNVTIRSRLTSQKKNVVERLLSPFLSFSSSWAGLGGVARLSILPLGGCVSGRYYPANRGL